MGLPRWCNGKKSACQCRRCKRCRFDPWVKKIPWSRKWHPLWYFCLENCVDKRAWQAIVHGFTKSQTQLNMYSCTILQLNIVSYMHELVKIL